MATLEEFLSDLAVNAQRLGEFIYDPESAMTAAELSDEDKNALISGFAGIIYARLAGLPTERAFQLPPQQLPPPFQQLPPQCQQLPPQFQQLPPQPPAFFQQLPPQIQQMSIWWR
jgi:hypothetical protein